MFEKQTKAYVVYELLLRKGKNYIGYTSELTRRLHEHRRSSKYGRAYLSYSIVFESDNKDIARQAEALFIDIDFENNDNKIAGHKKLLAELDEIENKESNRQAKINLDIENCMDSIQKIEMSIDELHSKLEIENSKLDELLDKKDF